ncbi:MAG: hypothetical protein JWP97_1488 [Labilithrix sp.]|nr:hypothetical protein [Labilithrix sp.]
MNLRLLPFLGAALVACAEPSHQEHGSLEITATSPGSNGGFATADGWNVKVSHLRVSLTELSVASVDGFVAASASPLVFDAAASGPQTLLFAGVRTARPWENVTLRIGPAALVDGAGPDPLGAVTAGDVDAMVKGGIALTLDAVATRGADSKALVWSFATDTRYADCAGEVDGATRPGLLVTPGGKDTADVVLSSSVLFADHLDPAAGVLRFDPIAAADADRNGQVTREELAAVSLAPLRGTFPGAYDSRDATAADLDAFTAELTRRLVTSFRAKGRCVSTPVAPE